MFDVDLGDWADRLFIRFSSALSCPGPPRIVESIGAKMVGHFSLEHESQGEGWGEIMKEAVNRLGTKPQFLSIHSLA